MLFFLEAQAATCWCTGAVKGEAEPFCCSQEYWTSTNAGPLMHAQPTLSVRWHQYGRPLPSTWRLYVWVKWTAPMQHGTQQQDNNPAHQANGPRAHGRAPASLQTPCNGSGGTRLHLVRLEDYGQAGDAATQLMLCNCHLRGFLTSQLGLRPCRPKPWTLHSKQPTWPGTCLLCVWRCSRAMAMPSAACSPARVSPREMLGRTGGRSAKPFRCLPGHCTQVFFRARAVSSLFPFHCRCHGWQVLLGTGSCAEGKLQSLSWWPRLGGQPAGCQCVPSAAYPVKGLIGGALAHWASKRRGWQVVSRCHIDDTVALT